MPVIIAGVALSAIGSTMFNLNTYIAYEKKGQYIQQDPALLMGENSGEKEEKAAGQYLNGTDVNVSLNNYDGYDFLGWFNGDNATYTAGKKLSDNASYTFELGGDTQLTALLRVKQYNLKFEGDLPEGGSVGASYDGNNYEYGQELPNLTDKQTSSVKFLGWSLVGNSAEKLWTAKFDTSNKDGEAYILHAEWSNRLNVIYYTSINGTPKEITSVPFTEEGLQAFTFLTKEDAKVKEAIGRGYTFNNEWTDETGRVVTESEIRQHEFTPETPIKLYMKKTAIKYTVNVKKFEGSVGEEVAKTTYDVENNLGQIKLERKYYNLVGLTFNGVDYTRTQDGEEFKHVDPAGMTTTLASAILDYTERQSVTEVTTTAIWHCDYDQLVIKYFGVVDKGVGDYDYVYGVKGGERTALFANGSMLGGGDYLLQTRLFFNDLDDNDITALETRLFNALKLDQYEKFEADPELDDNYKEVTLKEIVIKGASVSLTLTQVEDDQIYYAIEKLIEEGYDVAENEQIEVHFMFQYK